MNTIARGHQGRGILIRRDGGAGGPLMRTSLCHGNEPAVLASCSAALRGHVPPPERADPPDRGGVQPRDAQRHGIRAGGRLRAVSRFPLSVGGRGQGVRTQLHGCAADVARVKPWVAPGANAEGGKEIIAARSTRSKARKRTSGDRRTGSATRRCATSQTTAGSQACTTVRSRPGPLDCRMHPTVRARSLGSTANPGARRASFGTLSAWAWRNLG